MALRLNGSSSGYVELEVPAAAGSHTLTLPDDGGTSGQYLQTNGSGTLSWQTVTSPVSGYTWLDPVSLNGTTGATVTGIDTDAAHILVVWYDVSVNTGTSNSIRVRLGNGSLVSTGNEYSSCAIIDNGTNYSQSDDGANSFITQDNDWYGASDLWTGQMFLTRVRTDGTAGWTMGGEQYMKTNSIHSRFCGRYSGSEAIDRVQIFTGANSYDGGFVRVGYQA